MHVSQYLDYLLGLVDPHSEECIDICDSALENASVTVFPLRWLETVSSTFQDLEFDGSLQPLYACELTPTSWYQ